MDVNLILRNFNSQIEDMQESVEVLKSEAETLEGGIERLVETRDEFCKHIIVAANDFHKEENLIIGSHECAPSPIGLCAYDSSTDPGDCDECIFCKTPRDRD